MLLKALKFSVIAALLVTIVAIQILIVFGGLTYDSKGTLLTFRNNSSASIESVNIVVASKSCAAQGLIAGGEITCQLTNMSESSYNVVVTLLDGRVVSNESMGYVSGGMNFHAVITLDEQSELHIEQSAPDDLTPVTGPAVH